MSQAGSLFVRGLDTGAGWFEDSARRRLAYDELARREEADRLRYEAAMAEQEYQNRLAQQKADQEWARQRANAEFAGGVLGQPVDPNLSPELMGRAVGDKFIQTRNNAALMLKETLKKTRLGQILSVFPKLDETIRNKQARNPQDPTIQPLVNWRFKLMDEAAAIDADDEGLAGAVASTPDLQAKPSRQGDPENAVLRAQNDLVLELAQPTPNPKILNNLRTMLDKTMRMHALRVTGSAPETFYRGGVSVRGNFDPDENAWNAYRQYVGGNGQSAPQSPNSSQAVGAPTDAARSAPTALSDSDESDLTPEEQAAISLMMAEEDITYDEAEARILQARGQQP